MSPCKLALSEPYRLAYQITFICYHPLLQNTYNGTESVRADLDRTGQCIIPVYLPKKTTSKLKRPLATLTKKTAAKM